MNISVHTTKEDNFRFPKKLNKELLIEFIYINKLKK